MFTDALTAVANTAAKLLDYDLTRLGAAFSNPLSAPIYVSKTNPPPISSASIIIPAATTAGAGQYIFEGQPYEEWWFITAVSGLFNRRMW